jgi:hypothetical protein
MTNSLVRGCGGLKLGKCSRVYASGETCLHLQEVVLCEFVSKEGCAVREEQVSFEPFLILVLDATGTKRSLDVGYLVEGPR